MGAGVSYMCIRLHAQLRVHVCTRQQTQIQKNTAPDSTVKSRQALPTRVVQLPELSTIILRPAMSRNATRPFQTVNQAVHLTTQQAKHVLLP